MANENTTEEKKTGLNKLNWTKLAIRGKHGAIDMDATLAAIAEQLDVAVGNEVDMGEISAAVNGVFTKLLALPNGGTALNGRLDLAEVVSRASNSLDAPHGSMTMLQDRIKGYIKGESKRFIESNGAEGSLVVRVGKNGGVIAATETFRKEYQTAQAKNAPAAE